MTFGELYKVTEEQIYHNIYFTYMNLIREYGYFKFRFKVDMPRLENEVVYQIKAHYNKAEDKSYLFVILQPKRKFDL